MAYAGLFGVQQRQPAAGGCATSRTRKITVRRSANTRSGTNMESVLDPQIQAEIGRHLRDIYQAVLDQPVPERFVELLADLEQQERTKSG